MSKKPPTITAAKRYPQYSRERRGGENVLWKRITSVAADAIRLGANPDIATPLTRLVVFKHLTPIQGMAGQYYAEVMRRFERYHVAPGMRRTAKSQSIEPSRGGEDQEIERHINRGTLTDYEREARRARKTYDRLMKVMDGFKDPLTGRNFAKDSVENLVLLDQEPETLHREDLALILTAIAKEFDITEGSARRRASGQQRPRRRK